MLIYRSNFYSYFGVITPPFLKLPMWATEAGDYNSSQNYLSSIIMAASLTNPAKLSK